MLRENLKDSAEILQNIFQEPLEIPGVDGSISLFQAIQNYSAQQPNHSELSKMLRTFAANPQPLGILIQELQLIAKDLTAHQ
jgi:hypothetical protein